MPVLRAQNIMATAPKPTIVLVSGAWCVPAHYSALTRALESAGYPVHAPTNPTCSGKRPATASFDDDVRHIRALLATLVAAGKSVLLLMHSYGGAVGTSALIQQPGDGQYLTAPSRRARGLPGGVAHLVYLCAYMLPAGWGVMEVVEKAGATALLVDAVEVRENDGAGMLRDPVAALCHDLTDDPAEQQRQADLLVWFPLVALRGQSRPGAEEAWREVPTTYVRTTEDRCVPPAYQDIMLDEVQRRGVKVRQVVLQTSHAVYATKTQKIVQLVEEIAMSEGSLGS